MHSIHVDRGVHTIFPGMIAAAHDDLQLPLPLLSLSSGYLLWTKGLLCHPRFFVSIAHIGMMPPGPMSNLYTGFMPFLSAWIAESNTLFGEE